MKICLVGAGNIARFHHMALQGAGAEVTAVCTRGDSGARYAEQYDLTHYTELQRLIDREQPDGVCVLTQPESYGSILRILKANEIPTLLEKPVAYDSDHAHSIRPHLPRLTMVGHNRRFYGNICAVPAYLDTSPVTAHFHVCERAKDIRTKPQSDRDRWHILNAVHGIDLIRFLFGDIEDIQVLDRRGNLDFTKLPQFVHARLRTVHDHIVYFSSNLNSPGGWRCFAFSGDREIAISPIEKTIVRSPAGTNEIATSSADENFKPGFLQQAETFLNGIRTPHRLPLTWVEFDDALRSIELCERLYEREPVI